MVVIETADGTVWAGGAASGDVLRSCLRGVTTASNDLIFGFASARDPLRDWLPAEPTTVAAAIDFTDREPPPDEPPDGGPLPPEARLERIDRRTLRQIAWYEDTIHAFGSVERWEALGVAYAVVVGDLMVANGLAGPRSRGLLEMGVITRAAYRGRGFGTAVSRRVAQACEAAGDRVWWNANIDNAPSIAIARRLGFRHERRYELVACGAPLR